LTKIAAKTPSTGKPVDKAAAAPAAVKAAAGAAAVAAPATPAVPATKAVTKPVTGKSAGKTGGKASSKAQPKPETPAQVPSTALSGGGNRFTDRFAPSPPSKQPDPIEVQKSLYKADPKLVNAWKTKTGRDLSEAELMAMPDGEYMNDKQLDFFRARLQIQKDELLANAGETTEHLREDTSIVPDPADRATIEEEHALELRTRDRERKLLKKVAQSLTRIDSGEYGFCDETGEPIGIARLLARSTATLSLEAQQRREMKQKMFGD
jgi:DnaK suppressor protein